MAERDGPGGVDGLKSLLTIFAHPDDETFRCGGTLALLARHGVRVQVLTATRGEAGSCGQPPVCRPAELPAVRERELRCACTALGLELPRLLDYQDSHLAEADPEELTARILTVVQMVSPQVMLTFGPDGLSGHPDHVVIGRCAAEAFRRAENVASLYTMAVPTSVAGQLDLGYLRPVPDSDISLTVDVTPVWQEKMAAIFCHATQLSSSPLLSALPEIQRLFFGREHFVQVAVRQPCLDFMAALLISCEPGGRRTSSHPVR